MSNTTCIAVTPECPVKDSIYGYRPNLAANCIFLAVFALSTLVHTFQGIKRKMWTFLIALSLGCLLEVGGMVGKLMLWHNVWDRTGFNVQICLLTIAPAFIAAGIYVTLKHLVMLFGSHLSRLQPAHYTYIFIGCDFFSLVLQGAGGGIAATSDTEKMLDIGDDLMITGLAFQVFTLLVFAALAGDFFLSVYRHRDSLNPSTNELRSSRPFKAFLAALALAYTTVLVRCIYRVIELSGGWGNKIMQNEPSFLVLDPFMIAVAVLALNIFHPGRFLPSMSNPWKKNPKANEGSTFSDSEHVAAK